MKKTATYIALAALATSCAFSPKASMGGDGGEVTNVSGTLHQIGEFVEGFFDTQTKTFTAASAG